MSQENANFFATQIAQQSTQQQPQQQPAQQVPIERPETASEIPPKPQQTNNIFYELLAAFNSYDKTQIGSIKLQEIEQIVSSKGFPPTKVKQYHRMGLPKFEDMTTFDQFLFIYYLLENNCESIQEKYKLCQKVDQRLIQYIKLLNNHRRRNEKKRQYNEAKACKKTIEEVRQRQIIRKNKYLSILYDYQLNTTKQNQKTQFEQFCLKWDRFMNDYEAQSTKLLALVKDKHLYQVKQYQNQIRQELSAKMHFSKYLLELELKEKNLVKLQEYEKAEKIRDQINEIRIQQIREKEQADEQTIGIRVSSLRKQKEATISTILQKFQKDRNVHLKQRQSQTEKLIIKNKSQLAQIDYKFNQTAKKIYETLHSLGVETQRPK